MTDSVLSLLEQTTTCLFPAACRSVYSRPNLDLSIQVDAIVCICEENIRN